MIDYVSIPLIATLITRAPPEFDLDKMDSKGDAIFAGLPANGGHPQKRDGWRFCLTTRKRRPDVQPTRKGGKKEKKHGESVAPNESP